MEIEVVKDGKGDTLWYAYCPECDILLDHMANGSMCEACGRKHVKETGHKVLIAFAVDKRRIK